MTYAILKQVYLNCFCILAIGFVAACESPAAKEFTKTGTSERSCMPPDFDPKTTANFIGLSSPLYPAVEAKSEAMSDRMDSIPKTDLEAMMQSTGDMVALGAFVSLTMVDAFIPLASVQCDYQSYESSKCRGMSMLSGGNVKIENVSKNGDSLTFTAVNKKRQTEVTIRYANADYDGLTMSKTGSDGVTVQAQWTRASNGTETLVSTASNGEITRYTEKSDCSGSAHLTKVGRYGDVKTTDFDWTSTRKTPFTLNYKICDVGKSGATDCEGGKL